MADWLTRIGGTDEDRPRRDLSPQGRTVYDEVRLEGTTEEPLELGCAKGSRYDWLVGEGGLTNRSVGDRPPADAGMVAFIDLPRMPMTLGGCKDEC